jgi:hypothetical protein
MATFAAEEKVALEADEDQAFFESFLPCDFSINLE